jgi:DNA-binding protein HU-beta
VPPKFAKKPPIPGFSAFTGRFVASYISQDWGESGAGLPGAQIRGADLVNKNDLIQKLADTTGLAKNDAAKAVDGVFDLIAATLKSGEEVRLTGFGVFVVATRAGGKGRNPQTGEEITIKPSKQPRFRPGKQLKDSLN